MGYVNFKEERYKATNQLKKRRENNKNLFEYFKIILLTVLKIVR